MPVSAYAFLGRAVPCIAASEDGALGSIASVIKGDFAGSMRLAMLAARWVFRRQATPTSFHSGLREICALRTDKGE
jgi:hypothetical protein